MPEFSIQILTPIWTGGANGKPNGLKMSGVIGGMRQAFEMLVRKQGGHTCNITDDEHRCLRKDEHSKLCPACRLFGCTGLGRAFKVDFNPDNKGVVFPKDDPNFPNRNHRNAPYSACSIDTWVATTIEGGKTVEDHESVKNILDSLHVAYSENAIPMKFTQLRNLDGLSVQEWEDLLYYLLAFMSRYRGLGAKVNLGWGQFDIEFCKDSVQAGIAAMKKFINLSQYSNTVDEYLPNADDCFSVEFLTNSYDTFTWFDDEPDRFPCIGYGMRYRFRRYLKFLELDHDETLPIDDEWRRIDQESWNLRIKWNESLAFLRALFGRDKANNNDKHAGLLGVSHAYTRNNECRVKLFGNLPKQQYRYLLSGSGTPKPLSWDRDQVQQFVIEEFKKMTEAKPYTPYNQGELYVI